MSEFITHKAFKSQIIADKLLLARLANKLNIKTDEQNFLDPFKENKSISGRDLGKIADKNFVPDLEKLVNSILQQIYKLDYKFKFVIDRLTDGIFAYTISWYGFNTNFSYEFIKNWVYNELNYAFGRGVPAEKVQILRDYIYLRNDSISITNCEVNIDDCSVYLHVPIYYILTIFLPILLNKVMLTTEKELIQPNFVGVALSNV